MKDCDGSGGNSAVKILMFFSCLLRSHGCINLVSRGLTLGKVIFNSTVHLHFRIYMSAGFNLHERTTTVRAMHVMDRNIILKCVCAADTDAPAAQERRIDH